MKLEQNYPNRLTSITYNTPVFDPCNAEQFLDTANAPMRFAIRRDPVSMFDMNATTTLKAPNFNLDLVKDSYNMVSEPSINNAEKISNSIKSVDPLMGLHTMNDSYYNPSTAVDFAKSAVSGAVAVETMGIL